MSLRERISSNLLFADCIDWTPQLPFPIVSIRDLNIHNSGDGCWLGARAGPGWPQLACKKWRLRSDGVKRGCNLADDFGTFHEQIHRCCKCMDWHCRYQSECHRLPISAACAQNNATGTPHAVQLMQQDHEEKDLNLKKKVPVENVELD